MDSLMSRKIERVFQLNKAISVEGCDARPNGWPGGQRWWVINPLPASKKVNCG